MILECDSCGATLRASQKVLGGGHAIARCPQCDGSVSLAAGEHPGILPVNQIRLDCSCGARLKAEPSRVGRRNRCPKCHSQVMVQVSSVVVGSRIETPPATNNIDSGATTCRIDSRRLRTMPVPGGEVDLEELAASGDPAEDAPQTRVSEGDAAIAQAFMNPPVESMKAIATAMRESAMKLTDPAPGIPAQEMAARQSAVKGPPEKQEMKPAPARMKAPARSRQRQVRSVPIWAGVLAGGLSGAIAGGAWIAAETLTSLGADGILGPLPAATERLGLSDGVLRLIILALLGTLTGLLTASTASSKRLSMSLVRCLLFAVPVGAAFGVMAALNAILAKDFMPVVYWARDMGIVGFLMAPLARLFAPSSR